MDRCLLRVVKICLVVIGSKVCLGERGCVSEREMFARGAGIGCITGVAVRVEIA